MDQLTLRPMKYRNVLRNFVFTFGFAAFVVLKSFSQNTNDSSIVHLDSLQSLGNLIQRGSNDSVRISANRIFQDQLRNLLRQPRSTNLDSLKSISVVKSPDHSFTIITWQLPAYEGSYTFFGFIQLVNKKTHEPVVIELIDSTSRMAKPEETRLQARNWFGAVYYKMLTNKKDGKYYYTLLGWKGNNPFTTQKVIDVLYFSGDKALFGFPLFKKDHVYKNRLIFEYPAQAVMSLRYEENKKMIVFDHLSSGKKNQNTSAINGPDGTYDALRFKNGHWEILEDIDVNTGFSPKAVKEKPLKDDELRK